MHHVFRIVPLVLLLAACSPRAAVKEELAPLSASVSSLEKRVSTLERKVAALPDPAPPQPQAAPPAPAPPEKKPGGIRRFFEDLFGGVE